MIGSGPWGGPVPDGFTAVRHGNAYILVRAGAEALACRAAREEPTPGGEVVAGGRMPHPVLDRGDGTRVVARRFHRGGLVRHLVRDRYVLGHRAFAELRVTLRAAAAGVRVPEVLAGVEERSGLGYRALLLTTLVEDARDLDAVLREGPEGIAATALAESGSQIARLHDAGITHPDLNLRNLLVVGGGTEVWVLDFDRARAGAAPLSPRHRGAALRRFLRSARRLGVPLRGARIRAFADGYGSALPSGILR
jgi:tRNA A-37 threonylcarbamoyl transferase component Bud32